MGVKAAVVLGNHQISKKLSNMEVTDLFNTSDFEGVSIARVKKLEEVSSFYRDRDMFDYVLEGTGTVTIDGQIHAVQPGDLVFCPRETRFIWSEGVTLLAIATPRFQ